MTKDEKRTAAYRLSLQTVVTTILASLIIFLFQSFSDNDEKIEKDLDLKASIEYVDKQDKQLSDEIDNLDKKVCEKLDLIIILIQEKK